MTYLISSFFRFGLKHHFLGIHAMSSLTRSHLLPQSLHDQLLDHQGLPSQHLSWLICIHMVIAHMVVQTVKNPPAMQETWVQSWIRKIPWRRKQLPTAVFLPGKSHGQRRLVGYSLWGPKESDTTEH